MPSDRLKRGSSTVVKKEMNSAIQWEGQFYEALRHLTYARQLIEDNAESDSKNVIGEIYKTLLETAEICGSLKYYFCRNSIDKWITGEELSKEDFYLLAAQGVLVIPSESGLHEARGVCVLLIPG